MDTIKGYLRYEPEMRFTVTGKAVTKFALYDTSTFEGKWNNRYYVVVWEKLAEACNDLLTINDFVYARGYWKNRSWEDQETGEPVVRRELIADKIHVQVPGEGLRDIMELVKEGGEVDADSRRD